jgi:hypothetical protein
VELLEEYFRQNTWMCPHHHHQQSPSVS